MDRIQTAVELVRNSSNIVAFTGAGVSTESDIPDFRSAGGLYGGRGRQYDYPPEYMLSHSFFTGHPELFYEYYRNNLIHRDARPNGCHLALADLEKAGRLKAVVTQNIDGLHQAAGSRNVCELHGSVYRNYCLKCKRTFDLDYIINDEKPVPLCDICGGTVRPDVVLYEEELDAGILTNSVSYIMNADVLLVIGTSLVVYPAAGLINYYRGNKLILINKSSTQFDHKANIVINESASKIMKDIVASL